ncbi:uncharacterized protein LOC144558092 isoform X2 [Carex rostrata]
MIKDEEVLGPAMKQVAQEQAAAVIATEDLVVNLENIGSDDGRIGVVERETQPSNKIIALHDEDLRNICSWLGEYDTKTLWIESGDDCFAESMDQMEIPFLCCAKDISHIKDNKTDSLNNTSVQIKPENGRYREPHLAEKVMEHHGEIVESSQLETVGEDGGEATGDIPNLALGRVNDTESISDEKEGKAKLLEEGKEDLEEVGDDEEEYYLIEEIIEEGEEEEADIGESECVPTGEDLKEDEEHRQVVKKQCKRKEYEVFVGGLHRCASKDDIHEVFSQVGEVKSIRMAMDRCSNKNRGYAFVRYRTVEQARRALTELKNPRVHGKRCDVTASRENDTLFVGNICKTWSQELFKDKLKSYGVVNYKEVVLIQDNRYRGGNKGFAFLEFWSLAQATWAYVRLHKSNVVFGTDHAAKVSFAVFDKSEREITFQAKTVFLNGVPPTWDEDQIRSCLQRYGFIESVKLARDMNTAKRHDFAYVTFDTHNSACRCIRGINAGGLRKGHHKVRVEAQFCRPRNPRSNWNVKGNRDFCSKAKSTHDLHFSPSPQNRTPARIPKRIAEIRVLPTSDCGLKRPFGLSDRNQVSVSKKPRRMVSIHRSPRRMLQDQGCCVKRNAREHIDAEYNSHVIVERRHSLCRNKYCYTCEHVYSDRHSHSYNEYFRSDPHDLKHDIDDCYCEFPKRMDCSPDINEDLSIRQSKLWFDYAASSSRCAPCDTSSSRNRLELSNVTSGTGSSIYFRDKMYRGSDDLSYYRGSDGAGDFHGAYISSSSRNNKYYSQRSDGGANSYLSFHEHSSCCNSTSRGCRDCFKRESYRNF